MGFDPLSLIFGAADKVVDVLKGTGIIKDPEAEAKVKQVVSQIYVQELQAQTDFFKADVTANDPPWVCGLRASVRPVVTYVVTGMWLWNHVALMYNKTQFKLDQYDMALLGTVISFYFSGRLFEKLKEKDR